MKRKDKYFNITRTNFDVLALEPYLWNNADNVEVDAYSGVTAFYDLAGNGNYLTQSTSTDRPMIVTGITGLDSSIKGVKFDGVNDDMDSSILGLDSETEFEVWMVYKRNGNTDTWQIGGSNGVRVFLWGGGYERGRFRYTSGSYATLQIGTGTDNFRLSRYKITNNGIDSPTFENGINTGSYYSRTVGGGFYNDLSGSFRFGHSGSVGGGGHFAGWLFELIIFKKHLTDREADHLSERYINRKYNIW